MKIFSLAILFIYIRYYEYKLTIMNESTIYKMKDFLKSHFNI